MPHSGRALHCLMMPCVCDLVKLELKIEMLKKSLQSPQLGCPPPTQPVRSPTPPPITFLHNHQTSSTASLLSTNIFLREDRKRRRSDLDQGMGDQTPSDKKKKLPTYLKTSGQRHPRKPLTPSTSSGFLTNNGCMTITLPRNHHPPPPCQPQVTSPPPARHPRVGVGAPAPQHCSSRTWSTLARTSRPEIGETSPTEKPGIKEKSVNDLKKSDGSPLLHHPRDHLEY